jgi:hypothetical protein
MGLAPSRRLNLIALVVLAVALVAGAGLRIHAQQQSPNVQHDEAWSYASASGRLGPFLAAMDGGLTGRWVPASEWQRFWQSDGLADVKHIATDLSTFDVHPPLYFGLLHGWLTVAGENVWTGRALNLVFAALAILAIFGLARALGFDLLEGALAALVWAVSPAVVSISSITRQYDLVALTTVLLVWGLVRAAAPRPGRRRWPDVVWLAVATAAALLTHYQAVVLVAGGVVYGLAGVVLPRLDTRRRPWWPPLLGLAAGTLAAALLVPGWPGAFGRERSKLQHFSSKVFVEKLDAIAQTLGRFVGGPALVIATALLVVVVLLLIPNTRRGIVQRVRTARPGWWSILFFVLVTAGSICLQNLLFLSMPPRISARYLAMAWPFVAFLPLLFFGMWPRARYVLTAAFCLLVLVPVAIVAPLQHSGGDRMDLRGLAGADAVLVDNVGAGELPRFLWSVPADSPVFVGTQKEFLADQGAWSSADLGDKAYYVSILRSGGKYRLRNEILAELRRTHEVTQVTTNGFVYIYEITPKATP